MCGLLGCIGKSTDRALSFELLTKLFELTESRGIHASGYWATEAQKNSIFYHKQPTKSSEFIKSSAWLRLKEHDLDCVLCHTRKASSGVGLPCINMNNHPFVSDDKTLALIHNGKIDNHEYSQLIKKYTVRSECDSEVLLRIMQQAENYTAGELDFYFQELENPHRLAGIKDIFSQVILGHMAVAIGELSSENDKMLWLFRNIHRPLWMVDLRVKLGQVFFVSEKEIWLQAQKAVAPDLESEACLMELPVNQIWYFKTGHLFNFQRFEVKILKQTVKQQNDTANHLCKVVTDLDENDNLRYQNINSEYQGLLDYLQNITNELDKDKVLSLFKNKKIL